MKVRLLSLFLFFACSPMHAISEKLQAAVEAVTRQRSQKIQERIALMQAPDGVGLATQLAKKADQEEPSALVQFAQKQLNEFWMPALFMGAHLGSTPQLFSLSPDILTENHDGSGTCTIHVTPQELPAYGAWPRREIVRWAGTNLAVARNNLETQREEVAKIRGMYEQARTAPMQGKSAQEQATVEEAINLGEGLLQESQKELEAREKIFNERATFANQVKAHEESAHIKGNLIALYAYFAAQKMVSDAITLGAHYGVKELTGNETVVPIFSGTVYAATSSVLDHGLFNKPLINGKELASWMLADATYEGIHRVAAWLAKQRKEPVVLPIPQALREQGIDEHRLAEWVRDGLTFVKPIIQSFLIKPWCEQCVGGVINIMRTQGIMAPEEHAQDQAPERPLYACELPESFTKTLSQAPKD